MKTEERIIAMLDIQDRANMVAINFAGKTISSGDGTYDLLRYDVANAIREIVAAAIEAEREACAGICEEGIETARIVNAEGLISIASVMETLAKKIRTRSDGEKKEKSQ